MRSLLVLGALASLALAAPAAAAADPPQCSGGTVVVTPGQPKTLDFPNCDGALGQPGSSPSSVLRSAER